MTTATQNDDDFAAAFAELTVPGTKPADPPADPPPAADPPADPPPAADPPADPPPAADPPADPPPAADPPVDPPPAADPPPVVETEEQMRARIRAELEAELKKNAPAPVPAPAPAADPAPADTPPPVKIYSDAEEAALAKYKEDWPDIHAGEALARRQDMHRAVEHVFAQLRPILAELQTKVSVHSSRSMYDDIVDLVPDYDDVRDKTLEWIETQPEYLKNAYKHVTENGTAEEVADLINRYKRETGQPPTAAAAAPAAKPATPTVAPAAAAAAKALKPVTAGRSEPKATPDASDFDSAFAEFSKLN